MTKIPGALMYSEIKEAPEKFATIVQHDFSAAVAPLGLPDTRAIYTIARGSSDAAANILSYEYMAHLKLPVTSLPPSAFSLQDGVAMANATGLVVSQSGASSDLLKACDGIGYNGGKTLVLTNTAGSPASQIADVTIDMGAGPELAIPATKSVICTIGAGMAVLAATKPQYQQTCAQAAAAMLAIKDTSLPEQAKLEHALAGSDSIYVIGRGCGYGAAQEIALKLKETAALHAEAFSASEVLHGPLQLATKPLTVLILDTGEASTQDSLNIAQARFEAVNAQVFRFSPADLGVQNVAPPAAAALLLYALYFVVHNVTITLDLDPDTPETLAKITDTV
ncbi:MAG: SIS domain-containing protein [Paracoccaceae bacterium]